MSTSPIKLQALDIHKRYGANEVLKGVSLTANAGDVISIIGSGPACCCAASTCWSARSGPHPGGGRGAGPASRA
jgi:arginine/ornithine transport system ATP-binding protein